MADNLTVTSGLGTIIATDETAGAVHFQKIKLAVGTADSTDMIPSDVTYGLGVDVTRIATGTNNIGDVDIASIATGTTTIGAIKDAGINWTRVQTYTTSSNMTTAAAITAAPTAGQKIVLDDLLVSVNKACLFDIEMETTGNVLAAIRLPTDGSAQLTFRNGLKGDAADKKLYGKTSVAAATIYITASYHSET
jgi:hypothetical protein